MRLRLTKALRVPRMPKMKRRNESGITLFEVIFYVVIVFILYAVLAPHELRISPGRTALNQSLSNMKQLHLAAQQMQLDGITTGNTNLGWPGDIGGSFTNWTAQLLKGGYLTTSDLCKLLSAPGIIVSPNKLIRMNETAMRVYAVSTNSPSDAVFLTSANFTNTLTGGVAPNADSKPFGNKVVFFQIGGIGSILLPKQIGQINIIGSYVPLCR